MLSQEVFVRNEPTLETILEEHGHTDVKVANEGDGWVASFAANGNEVTIVSFGTIAAMAVVRALLDSYDGKEKTP